MGLTKEQMVKIIDVVESVLRSRDKERSLSSEADFLSGAISVIIALDDWTIRSPLPVGIPIYWILYPLSGRSVLEYIKSKDVVGL